MSIKIKKVKLIKEGKGLHLVFEDNGVCPGDVEKTGKNPVHPDLLSAMKKLSVHLAIMTEYVQEKNSSKNEDVDKLFVTGYCIGGKEGEEGIVITGYRKRKDNRIITLNTPFIRFEENEETRYILMAQLLECIKGGEKNVGIEKEVTAYLTEGKKGVDPQLSLDLKETPSKTKSGKVTKMKIVAPAAGSLDADPEAMKRVAEGDWENDGKTASGGKRGQQTAANPAGK